VDKCICPGQNQRSYAFSKTTVRRNLYRVPRP